MGSSGFYQLPRRAFLFHAGAVLLRGSPGRQQCPAALAAPAGSSESPGTWFCPGRARSRTGYPLGGLPRETLRTGITGRADGWLGRVQGFTPWSLPTHPVSPAGALGHCQIPVSSTHPCGMCSPAPGRAWGGSQAAASLLRLLEMGSSRIQCWRGPGSHDWELQDPAMETSSV